MSLGREHLAHRFWLSSGAYWTKPLLYQMSVDDLTLLVGTVANEMPNL